MLAHNKQLLRKHPELFNYLTKADRFFAGEVIFVNGELDSQSGSFLPATEYFFQWRTKHKPVSYLLPVFRYKYQRQHKMFSKPVYR